MRQPLKNTSEKPSSFITSRKGQLDHLNLYKYNYLKNIQEKDYFKKFAYYLYNSEDVIHWDKRGNVFYTVKEIPFELESMCGSIDTVNYTIPLENTQIISFYIAKIIGKKINEHFERFLNQNLFIIEKHEINQFELKQCVEINIEVFENGEFFIHFFPVSKTCSNGTVNQDYFLKLRSYLNIYQKSIIDELFFNIVCLKNFRRDEFALMDNNLYNLLRNYLIKDYKYIATFNTHFLKTYSENIWIKIRELQRNDIESSIELTKKVSNCLNNYEILKLEEKPFFEIKTENCYNKKSLLVGNNFPCGELSAAYHKGIYLPVKNKAILPIYYNIPPDNKFKEKLEAFNKGGMNNRIISKIIIKRDQKLPIDIIEERIKGIDKKDLLIAIFTKYHLDDSFLQSLRQNKLFYQICTGEIDNFQLSNFVIKCLTKLGGILNIIKNTHEPDSCYFAGIDLGHSIKKDGVSKLAIAFFDNKGIFIKGFVEEKSKKDESVGFQYIGEVFKKFIKNIEKHNLVKPTKLIIHRDGKLLANDVNHIVEQAKQFLKISDLDIIEIIKSGHPILAKYIDRNYENPQSGEYWIFDEMKYAILITNTQSGESGDVIKPIIIKHHNGKSNFNNILEQIYWFTKVYTDNLYNPTRLPATTQKANNLAGTGKIHRASYKG